MLSVGQQSLLGYLPALIIQNILDKRIDIMGVLPQYYVMHTVSLFADISGFTKLSEAFSKKGRIGPEFLAFSLNRYMEQLINIIGKNGGDIFKFAGDAILVIWPETVGNDLTTSCRRAVQCALDIQSKLNDVEISPDKKLSVKIGIGVGECRILVVGGQFKRCEYLSVGEALRQACESETKATSGGQTICSQDVKAYVNQYFAMDEIVDINTNHHHGDEPGDGMKFYLITKYTADKLVTKSEAYLMRTRFSLEKVRQKFSDLKTFLPAAISLYLSLEKESWSKEIRMLSIMFVNLKVDLSQTKNEEGIKRIQMIVKDVQRSIYRTRGALNKFLMDDKGSVMVICWGLPPMSCNDDHVRSILSALSLMEELKKHKCGALIGVTSGTCFTGVCGTIGNRREYSVLGEVVNLSARYMGEAIKFSKENKLDNMVFVDEVTKNLIQNKIRCEYVTSNNLKGFTGFFPFYTPVEEEKFIYSPMDPFPYIRTHRNNPKLLRASPDEKYDDAFYFNKSLVMAGRKLIKNKMIMILEGVYLEGKNELVVIRGVTGSGKSLFVRKSLYDFLWKNKNLLENNYNSENILIIAEKFEKTEKKKTSFNFNEEAKSKNLKPYFIFTSFQTPVTHNTLMNGFSKILREVYYFLLCFQKDSITNNSKSFRKIKLEDDKEVLCDAIGELLFKTNSITHINYIESILETNLSCHYSLSKNFPINFEECNKGDNFFDRIKCDLKSEGLICKFFCELVQMYFKTMSKYFQSVDKLKHQASLIFIIEDTQLIDDLSIRFIKALRDLESTKDFNSFCMILTYQDPLLPIMKSSTDRISRSTDIINEDLINVERDENDRLITDPADLNPNAPRTFMMENILDYTDLKELIKKHISDRIHEEFKTNLNSIDDDLLRIIISKSFKGVPLFVLDIVDNFINSKKYVQVLAGELIVTSELIDMEQMLDWSEFTVPMRMEKIVGSLIDALPTKEIILLKYASVVGNMFDLQKLNDLNPFNNITKDELYSMLVSLEEKGILEFLHDLNPKELVCKFSIPFFREILYQRMLIEQKNEIHLVLARSMQYNKLKYMPHDKEVKILKNHLKNSEKTLISQMEDDISEIMKKDKGMIHLELMMEKLKQNELNLNNLKIFSIKNICERLKCIDLKVEVQPEKVSDYYGTANYLETYSTKNDNNSLQKVNKDSQKIMQSLRSGYIEKMSEKSSLSWESRFVVVTNAKCMYFYHEKEFLENKMPLGSFQLENLYNVIILNDRQIGGKRNIFSLNLTSWHKKDAQKGHRKFFFSTKNREELYEWIITLNFMSVKATYDQFSSQYGLLKLPLRHQNQKHLNHKKIKEKFKGPEIVYDRNLSKEGVLKNTSRLYNNIVRKSGMNDVRGMNSLGISGKINSPNIRRTTISLMAKQVSFNNSAYESISEFGEMKDKITQSKDNMQEIFKLSIIFLGYIQEVILNADHVGYGDNKTIAIPEFLKSLRDDYESDTEEFMPQRSLNFLDSLMSEHKNIEQKRESRENISNYFMKFQESNKALTFNVEEVIKKKDDYRTELKERKNLVISIDENNHKGKSSRQSPKSQITFSNKKEADKLSKKIESKPINIVDDYDNLSSSSSLYNDSRKMSFENHNEKELISLKDDGYAGDQDFLDVDEFKENINLPNQKKLLSHDVTKNIRLPMLNKNFPQVESEIKLKFPKKKEVEMFKLDSENSIEESSENEENPIATEMSPLVEDEPNSYRIPEISKSINESGDGEIQINHKKLLEDIPRREFIKIIKENENLKNKQKDAPKKAPIDGIKNILKKEENCKNYNNDNSFSLSFIDNDMPNKEITQNLLNSKFQKNLINSNYLHSLILSKEQNLSNTKIEENLTNSKSEGQNLLESRKPEEKTKADNSKQDISSYFKPIQLGIRNKKEEKSKSNEFSKEGKEYNEPLDPSNIGKIKELIKQKSKKKKKFINNINFFLFNTINSNEEIVQKLNKISPSNEGHEGDNLMSETFRNKSKNRVNERRESISEDQITNNKKNSINSVYQQPKYDYLKKENSDHIYNNVHMSNIFRDIFNKNNENHQD